MNELRNKVTALLEAKLPKGTLVELLIDVIARGLGRLGGRPRKVPPSGEIGAVDNVNLDVPKPVTNGKSAYSVTTYSLSESESSSGSPEQICSAEIGERSKPETLPPGFAEFWALYPKRKAKMDAIRAWRRKRPPIGKVREALAWQVNCDQWRKGFVPNPATWINRGQWDDEPDAATANGRDVTKGHAQPTGDYGKGRQEL